jgi:predicted ATPase
VLAHSATLRAGYEAAAPSAHKKVLLNQWNQSNDRLFVITGGPGVGKTAIIHELERQGVSCVPEAARQIIQQQVSGGGNAVPWMNRERYASLMLKKSIEDYLKHAKTQRCTIQRCTFFDRGILDTIAYARLIGLHFPDETYRQAVACRYNAKVFLAPPWPQIYETDSERKQSYEEAVVVDRVIRGVYAEQGYEIIEIPQTAVAKRTDFILSRMKD